MGGVNRVTQPLKYSKKPPDISPPLFVFQVNPQFILGMVAQGSEFPLVRSFDAEF